MLSSRPKFYVLSSRRTIPSLHAVVTAQRGAARAAGGRRGLDLQVRGARTSCSPATRATCLPFLSTLPALTFPFTSSLFSPTPPSRVQSLSGVVGASSLKFT